MWELKYTLPMYLFIAYRGNNHHSEVFFAPQFHNQEVPSIRHDEVLPVPMKDV